MPKTKQASLDIIQRVVLNSYYPGEYDVKSPRDIDGCNDSLLIFLLRELSMNEDCSDIETAIGRIDKALFEINQVKNALLELKQQQVSASEIMRKHNIPGDIAPLCDEREFFVGILTGYGHLLSEEEKNQFNEVIATCTFPKEDSKLQNFVVQKDRELGAANNLVGGAA